MVYLLSADYASYGVADATDAQVNLASRLIDGRIGKPEGLLWSADANGQPAWMTSKTAIKTYSIAGATSPGLNTVALNGVNFGLGDIGSAVVIDRANTPETCIITAATGNTVTLATQFPHIANATMEYGLAMGEDIDVGYGNMIRTTASPLANVLSITGSYRGSRRRGYLDWIDELLSTTDANIWNPFPLSQCDIDETSGIIRMYPDAGSTGYGMQGNFSRVRVNYVAGWNYQNLPYQIKQACANLVNTMMNSDIPANIKTLKAGDATITNFNSSLFDADTDNLLRPYRNIRI